MRGSQRGTYEGEERSDKDCYDAKDEGVVRGVSATKRFEYCAFSARHILSTLPSRLVAVSVRHLLSSSLTQFAACLSLIKHEDMFLFTLAFDSKRHLWKTGRKPTSPAFTTALHVIAVGIMLTLLGFLFHIVTSDTTAA